MADPYRHNIIGLSIFGCYYELGGSILNRPKVDVLLVVADLRLHHVRIGYSHLVVNVFEVAGEKSPREVMCE